MILYVILKGPADFKEKSEHADHKNPTSQEREAEERNGTTLQEKEGSALIRRNIATNNESHGK